MSLEATVSRLRDVCLSFPEAHERPFGGHSAPTWRVRDKIFASLSEDLQELTFKGEPGAQDVLVGAQPEVFFVPAYVGHRGWIGVHLAAGFDWDTVVGLLYESWRMTAPKSLLKTLA